MKQINDNQEQDQQNKDQIVAEKDIQSQSGSDQYKQEDSGTDKDTNADQGMKPLASVAEDNRLSKLEAELEAIKKKAAENWDIALRAKAETENIRKRATIDLENAYKYSMEKFAREMLHIVDSLERGLESLNKDDISLVAIHEGMELTYKLLLDSLAKFAITAMDPIGEDFDPRKHEALSTQETNDVTPNKIMLVVQKGFMQHDRVLRHAKVIIAKAPQTKS